MTFNRKRMLSTHLRKRRHRIKKRKRRLGETEVDQTQTEFDKIAAGSGSQMSDNKEAENPTTYELEFSKDEVRKYHVYDHSEGATVKLNLFTPKFNAFGLDLNKGSDDSNIKQSIYAMLVKQAQE